MAKQVRIYLIVQILRRPLVQVYASVLSQVEQLSQLLALLRRTRRVEQGEEFAPEPLELFGVGGVE